MTNTDLILIGGAAGLASAVFGFIEAAVIKRHNERLIEDVHRHISASSLELGNSIAGALSAIGAEAGRAANEAKKL